MRCPEDSVQKSPTERVREWLNSVRGSLLTKAEGIGINTDLKTNSLSNRIDIEIPMFPWLERVCKRAIGERVFNRERQDSTESDYSRYFDIADDANTGTENENNPDTQHFKQFEEHKREEEETFQARSIVLQEVTTQNKTPSRKSLASTGNKFNNQRYSLRADGRAMSDPLRYLTNANADIMQTINRFKNSLKRQRDISNDSNESTFIHKRRFSKSVSEDIKQGELTLSMQYFANTSQLRLILLKAEGIKSNSGKIIVKITLLGPREAQRHVSRQTELFAGKTQFNDNFYFETENDEMYEYSIKLRMMKKRRFFRRSKTIGEVLINLGDLPLTLDTNIVAPLYKPQYSDKKMDATDLLTSSQKRSIQEDVMASLEITDTMQLRSSLKRVNSLPINGLQKVRTKPFPNVGYSTVM